MDPLLQQSLRLKTPALTGLQSPPFAADQDYFEVGHQSADIDKIAEALDFMRLNPLFVLDKKFPVRVGPTHRLVLINGQIYWSTAKVVAVALPTVDALEGAPAFENAGYDWLTYETVLNKPKFRKTNQGRQIGLYAAHLSDMQIWFRDDLTGEPFLAMCESFFPDHTPDEVRLLSKATWWWKQQDDLNTLVRKTAPYYEDLPALLAPDSDHPARFSDTADKLPGSRSGLRIHLPRMIVMPYNIWDNALESKALGTGPTVESETGGPAHPIPLLQLKHLTTDATSWTMWPTASRSSVMLLSRVKAPQALWPANNWTQWPFDTPDADRVRFKYAADRLPFYVNAAFKAEVQRGTHFKLSQKTDYHFSVKTGVCFVGFDKQTGANKDVIGKDDEWLVGCMRSDTIKAIEKLARGRGAIPQDLLIQTEIMMALERFASPNLAKKIKYPDGVALRDMSLLDSTKNYIPPLSIPFIANDGKTLTQEFALVDDPGWCNFWQSAWAEALGKAKALFLVQYAMQHANPNVQNYLIEMTPGPPPTLPVRIIIRDVADALLVREVAWALFGKNEPCPQAIDAHAELKTMRLPVLRYNFRSEAQAHENETGSTKVSEFGPIGIQFLWQRFSTFYGGWKGDDKLAECPADRLAKVLRLMARWGIAHTAAYVRTVETALGTEFGTIRWDQLLSPDYSPENYVKPGNTNTDYDRLAKADMTWEETAADVLREAFRDALRPNVCAYHNRAWANAIPRFSIVVKDDAGQVLAHTVVYVEDTATHAITQRLTDPKGHIPFFLKDRATYKFSIGRGPHKGGPNAWTIDQVILGFVSEASNIATYQAPAPQPPVVTLTPVVSPVVGAAVAISATATPDIGRTIVSLQFRLGVDNLGPALTVAPFDSTFDSTAHANAEYDFTATATDSGGLVTVSAAQRLTIHN